jgi:hypothetical protein
VQASTTEPYAHGQAQHHSSLFEINSKHLSRCISALLSKFMFLWELPRVPMTGCWSSPWFAFNRILAHISHSAVALVEIWKLSNAAYMQMQVYAHIQIMPALMLCVAHMRPTHAGRALEEEILKCKSGRHKLGWSRLSTGMASKLWQELWRSCRHIHIVRVGQTWTWICVLCGLWYWFKSAVTFLKK